MDMKLELVPLPVADVDRAKSFYTEKLGFVADVDVTPVAGVRVVQVTSPGSACSIGFGTGLPAYDAAPGTIRSLHLVVADIEAARSELISRGVEMGARGGRRRWGQVRRLRRPGRQHVHPAGDGLAHRRQLLGPGRGATLEARTSSPGRGMMGVVTDPDAELPTLYTWAGGADAVRRLIDSFYDRVEVDDLLASFFPGGVTPEHRDHVAAWWSEVLGGPARYTSELGGYARMLAHHRGLAVTSEQRHRFVATMSLAADDAGLPDDPEFRSALVGYVEWGSRLALLNSQPGAEVVEHAPVPRWGWGVAPPYRP